LQGAISRDESTSLSSKEQLASAFYKSSDLPGVGGLRL
jgi:hypothetical protein